MPSTNSGRDLASRRHHLFHPETELVSFLLSPVTRHLTPISSFCLSTLTPMKAALVALLEGSSSVCQVVAKGDAREVVLRLRDTTLGTRRDASSSCWSLGKWMALYSPGNCHFSSLLKPAGGFGERVSAFLPGDAVATSLLGCYLV